MRNNESKSVSPKGVILHCREYENGENNKDQKICACMARMSLDDDISSRNLDESL